MECIGARNLAAMAVSKCPTTNPSTRKKIFLSKTHFFHYVKRYSSITLRIKCSSRTRSEGCVAVEEEFADKEDYVKAGGSELLYVQMQQNKHMDQQSKLSDKVYFLALHFSIFFNFLKILSSTVNIMMFLKEKERQIMKTLLIIVMFVWILELHNLIHMYNSRRKDEPKEVQ